MNILITGGTGFLGGELIKRYLASGHNITVHTRSPAKVERLFKGKVSALTDFDRPPANEHYQAIINLSGAPIIGGRWTTSRKKTIRQSRIDLTQSLVDFIGSLAQRPSVLVSGSAIGFYGDQADLALTEQSQPVVDDFSQQLCSDWERAALEAEQHGVRVCLVRTGLVLGNNGGLLKQMLLPYRLGLGGALGSGKQWMSWIHLRDWLNIVETLVADPHMQGPYNAVAPQPVINREFSNTLAELLGRPQLMPIPALPLKCLLGEMSALLLGSQRVVPQRLLDRNFQFEFTELRAALADILGEQSRN